MLLQWLLLLLLLLALLLLCTLAAPAGSVEKAKKVFVLGVDGMDPKLLVEFAEEGSLPNLKRLMEQGDYAPLQTSMPPLSPIAWSTFME